MASSKEYNLPVTDTQKERRNFPGFEKNTYYNLADMQERIKYSGGTTDTDTVTDPGVDKGLAKEYLKKGKPRPKGGQTLGTTVKLDSHSRIG